MVLDASFCGPSERVPCSSRVDCAVSWFGSCRYVVVANVFSRSKDVALGARSEPGTGHLVVGGQRPNLAGFPPAERNKRRWTLCRTGVRVRRFASLYFSSDRNSRIPE